MTIVDLGAKYDQAQVKNLANFLFSDTLLFHSQMM